MQRLLNKIDSEILELLKSKKSLLGFSHGTDSTALFHTLNELGASFDLAMINYKTRPNSDIEMQNATKLAKEFGKTLHLKIAPLDLENGSNFEHRAREIRYEFFDELMSEYDILILGHNLNDKLEWFLMQLLRGSGLANLLSPQSISKRRNYAIVRPFLNFTKAEILEFLDANNLKYFIDESNFNTKFKRNYIRENFSDPLLKTNPKNIARSFEYLERDRAGLFDENLFQKEELFIIKNSPNSLNSIDKICKILGTILSKKQRDEIEKNASLVISSKIAISKSKNLIFISPYQKAIMDKNFKEKCRILKIPPLNRGYIFNNQNALSALFDRNFIDKIGQIDID